MFGIAFLNTTVLFASLAVVVPLLIYLFAKKKPRRIIFSSIRFIKESQQKQKRKINLKNILLLIIRMLIILFTILAISRPAVKSALLKSSTKHPKTSIAIILDNSYSMNYLVDTQADFEIAKQILYEINDEISENDNVFLLTLNENWNNLYGAINYGKISTGLIDKIEISSQIMLLKDVIKLAEKKLKDTHLPNREIYVITDLQKYEFPQKNEIPTFIIPTSNLECRHNISCQNANLQHQIVNDNLQKQLNFEIINHSTIEQKDVVYQLFLNGNTVAEKVVNLQPKQRKKISFSLNADAIGWQTGYVNVKNERLIFDNKSYFSFYLNPNPKVAVITDVTELPFALKSVLQIYSNDVELLNSDNFNLDNLQKYDNVILYKKLNISAKLENILTKIDRKIIILDENISESWEKYFLRVFECKLTRYNHKKRNLNFINKYHAVTSIFSDKKNTEIRNFWEVDCNSKILLQTDSMPLSFEMDNTIIWLFDIEKNNPFLFSSIFPIFAYNSLKYTELKRIDVCQIGGKFQLNSSKLILPNGEEITTKKSYFYPNKIGIYQNGENKIAVNLNYAESNYEKIEKLKNTKVQILDKDWKDKILQSRYGFELWKYLILMAIFLFALEMLIIKKTERK